MTTHRIRNFLCFPFVATTAILFCCPPAHAAIEPRSILKTFFETGDVPTQDQFSNLIDSYIHQTDDGLTLTGIGATPDGSAAGRAIRVGGNVGINELLPDTFGGTWKPYPTPPGTPLPQMCSMFCGTSGFLPLKYAGSDGPHYGFLQIDMGADPAPCQAHPSSLHNGSGNHHQTPRHNFCSSRADDARSALRRFDASPSHASSAPLPKSR